MIPNAGVDVKHFSLTSNETPKTGVIPAKKPPSDPTESGLIIMGQLMMRQQIKQNRKEMRHAAAEHKQMPNRMVVREPPPYIENRP